MKHGDFTEIAKYYYSRPAYSLLLIEKLIRCINIYNKPLSDLCIVEVGAGTGKLTKILSKFGVNIIAVEPNDNMRNEGLKYTKDCNNIVWVKGSGEATGLDNNIADWVVMASSFHWTNPNESLPEFSRILKQDGHFTAMWNPRNIAQGSIFYDIEQEILSMIPNLKRVSSGSQNVKKWEEILVSTGDFEDCIFMECDYVENMSSDRYMDAWRSVNDIQAQAGTQWGSVLQMIENKISHMDTLEVPYKIRAWTVKKTSYYL